ncbi:MAG: hypothetical protein HDT27_10115 [Subdoligranulum sp.]|nr:hypothetical protein [Subdoligranulum sp.]
MEKYSSVRQFGIAYIKYTGETAEENGIQNISNRLSQIKTGQKSIQLRDLPVLANLLELSCEEILSAGRSFVLQSSRASNYSIAFSKNQQEWLDYINREDKLILNPDEYGKTALDYAIEFQNYDLIRFLIREKYIWFDSRKDQDYIMTFGAGTSIQRRDPCRIDDFFQYKLSTEDQLRIDIISLAVAHDDTEMLNELHARELPELYSKAHYLYCAHPDIDRRYDENFVRSISKASDQILSYFTDEFEIRDDIKYKDGSHRTHIFVFPFLSRLLDLLIRDRHKFAKTALRKAIQHNERAYQRLKELIENAIAAELSKFSFYESEYADKVRPDIVKGVLRNFDFYENGNIVSFRDPFHSAGIITNIVRTETPGNDPILNSLIGELNALFEKIEKIGIEFV